MPGTRHAKNNTALGFFTNYEKQKTDWGSKKVRLGKETTKKFDCCTTCLKICEDPMCCPNGDLFCKGCILQSLLTQRKKIKQQMIDYQHQQIQQQQEKMETEQKKTSR